MKKKYIKPELYINVINVNNSIMSASLGGDTGYYPGGLIGGGDLTDEDLTDED